MTKTMLRPRWILALLLALLVAAAFALLGRWQLERAIASGEVVERTTETVQPLAEAVPPDGPPREAATGQLVTVDGSFLPGDEQLISDRFNGGASGFWVVSRFITADDAANIAVARGWAPTERAAAAAIDEFAAAPAGQAQTLTGRFVPSEAPVVPDETRDPHTQTTVSTAALINEWRDFTDQSVYAGYIVDTDAAAGLARIDSPAPVSDASINWLNIFYALEWAVFAGFAVFLWYRLARDAWEREQEQAAIAAAEAV
ncbi:SURF1 family protein [Cryobacterium sp. TMT2-10]|uniref:SURF1-like protein n=1 Tax=Cryobacterium shii TaxID=1259235 RepID=A0AAQ2C4N4_9MICO|nr:MULTISPECIES: SURF1 family protein [Cryobacterium]TFC43354.1 SURF1 family protein [Cryobacterium shii]TFC87322.1 SURF1 family protein [Cryobacterium sp. TmT2-59]TFD17818.1 SURF1 family protein [Cryobacterium sp. TMT2-23]TFD18324.1 SURF1 family protein [Cryobacterium sp. TMT4-10]TFD39236.1 SURF1 family protein [Cryobacterium sp. TMT2-10]